MHILFVEPFFSGSHRAWIEGIEKYSSHKISMLTLPGRYWKWRMHGGAVTLAKMFNEAPMAPDLIVASDMLDLTVFLALTREKTSRTPTALYFHENQLTYPWSPQDRDLAKNRDRHYGFINYSSAMAADRLFFNSEFHMDNFLNALGPFLKQFPDYNELVSIDVLREKSKVLYLGLDLSPFDEVNEEYSEDNEQAPLLLWNHRWEYDKNPEGFFGALFELQERDVDFRAAVLGEEYDTIPPVFNEAREKLGDKIAVMGYAPTFEEYASWLHRADILPVTSIQDFFGISIMEALYCKTIPLLPRRLTYPELVDPVKHKNCFYEKEEDLVSSLEKIIEIAGTFDRNEFRDIVGKFRWEEMISLYDAEFKRCASKAYI